MSVELALRLLVILVAFGWAAWRFERLARPLRAAAPEPRLRPFGPRAWGLVVNVLGHARLLRKPYSGLLHVLMFSGFLFLLTAVVQVLGNGVSPAFDLDAIGGSTWIAYGQDVFGVLLLIAVGMAAFQRVVWAPSRFTGSNRQDAAIILGLITAVVVGMLLQNGFRAAAGADPSVHWRPVSSVLGTALAGIGFGPDASHAGAIAFAWVHMLAVLAFLVYLPGSKHLHVVVAVPNVYLRDLAPAGRLCSTDLERPPLGLSDIRQLGRKQVLDLYACTECGRCQELCPAYAAGKPLSPKRLIMDLRDHLRRTADGKDGREPAPSLLGGAIREETIWSCTSCRACMEACPLFIEHVPKIVEMRRHLAMESGRVPEGVSGAMLSVERRGHPWAGTPFSRLDWCRDLDVRVLAPGQSTDTLLWVGCTAALDVRAQKVARSLVRVLRAARVDFAILGDAESCTGDAARRTGNDYLFQVQAAANVATLNARRFRRIVCVCPHCMNTLKNEYGQFGGAYEVVHHSQLLDELMRAGRLPRLPGARDASSTAVAYHDPCYLGRYNGEYEAPRQALRSAGCAVNEMERSRARSFCCGGGGGRAFAVEPPGQRVNLLRAQQARATGASIVATACPFCLLMLEDGCKAAARAEGPTSAPQSVRDLAEIVDEALHGPSAAAAPAARSTAPLEQCS